ncbi:aldo/keto reductase [Arcanobacterium pinnipediorum]|uniref:Aldo/keto reductase n=1 Tax=Arcanobacterium pinnipediorum TaxID=1503041 RepID=A0ABY5AHQ9_9ACTO|nr:aldo/keto reductase [Arcanobacterium pinnipediorum]USR79395.1 aldo/keto reductase [Arcanobacterium pinnipediorum]
MTRLSTGYTMPALGFGTYQIPLADTADLVQQAFAVGYRHIDTAQMYGNEAGVGRAMIESGLARASIFITTKLNNPNHEADKARESFAQSLRNLRTEYVDLFLIHWPLPMHYGGDFPQTFKTIESFVAEGRARSVGVSNFEIEHIEKLVSAGCGVPAVNQIEIHPYFQNRDVVDYCRKMGITVESWSPLGRGEDLKDPVILEIADKHHATPAQVVLAWHLAENFVVIPKSSTLARQQQNFDSLRVTLDYDDLAAIRALDRGADGRRGPHPNDFSRLS